MKIIFEKISWPTNQKFPRSKNKNDQETRQDES